MRAEEYKMLLNRCTVSAIGAALALLLSGCSPEPTAPPEPDLEWIESTWDMEVPPGVEVLEYYSSEVDFHGGRDDVYVLKVPIAERSGFWDPSTYTEGLPYDGSPAVGDIVESAGAGIRQDALDSLQCAKPSRADQNYILACHDEESDQFYLFEQIF